jgi:asparagine synthase (glutamine-hydrolysing)
MFAYAIWDDRRQSLLLARDRVGKKPLYYYSDANRMAFASELKALLQVPWVPRQLDSAAVGQYLTFGYIPAPRSILKGVRKLCPGHHLRFDRDSSSTRRYWDLPTDLAPTSPNVEESVDALDEVLGEAVAIRMGADVPLGAFLSGGIDSSLVVALMARHSNRSVRSFSVGFSDGAFNELAFAEDVARHIGTDHCSEVVNPDVPNALLRIADGLDEPFADSSIVPTFIVSEMARRHVTVALSGDGGDEAFAGYDHYRTFLQARRWGRVPGIRQTARLLSHVHPLGMKGESLLHRVGADPEDQYWATMSISSTQLRRQLVRREMRSELLAGAEEAAAEIYRDEDWSGDPLSAAQRVDLTRGYLHGDILVKVDMASMLNSLEVRSPLLDHLVIEHALRLPTEMRASAETGKVLLRRLAARYLPTSIIERPKHGFTAPVDRWLRSSLAPLLDETVLTQDAHVAEFLDLGAVAKLVNRHRAGVINRGSAIFLVLSLELWLRSFARR